MATTSENAQRIAALPAQARRSAPDSKHTRPTTAADAREGLEAVAARFAAEAPPMTDEQRAILSDLFAA